MHEDMSLHQWQWRAEAAVCYVIQGQRIKDLKHGAGATCR